MVFEEACGCRVCCYPGWFARKIAAGGVCFVVLFAASMSQEAGVDAVLELDFFQSFLSNGYPCSESALLLREEQIAPRVTGLCV